jgi:ubiquinone/menaquinone biosynthesis C-methylase UbiE
MMFACAKKQPTDPMLDPLRTELLRPAELIDRLHLEPNARVADIGAGPGFWTLSLARAVPRGRVIATDIRPEPLATLRDRARAQGLDNIETHLTPADDPQLDPASIDLVFLCQVDQYLPDRRRYLAKLARTLAPGGRIVLVNYARYLEPDLEAARTSSLAASEPWRPSSAFFSLVLTRKP